MKLEKNKSTLAEIIAQHWMFSCDAPDSDITAMEIQRLAKMIEDGLVGKDIPWRIVNSSLFNLNKSSIKRRAKCP